MERETDQEIRDRQDQELEEARRDRAERLGHDIHTPLNPRNVPRTENNLDAVK
jgi:hypothetical protein